MNRTYDIFADNGLFVLSYYIKKDIEEITYSDIENTIDFMSDKVEEFLDCDKYSNLKSMVLSNSAVINSSLKNVKLSTVLNDFVNNTGNDICMICGEKKANIKGDLKGRSYLPNRPAATFFNFSNNLHGVNICPYCLVLTTYSVMNCRVDNQVYLYNSSDDEFMNEITILRQEENKRDILSKAGKLKGKSRFDTLEELLDHNIEFESQIELYRFKNGKTEEIEDIERIYSDSIMLIRKLRNKALLSEFKEKELMKPMVEGKLKSTYINLIYDFEKDKLKCNEDLFDFLNKEVNMLDEKTIAIVKRIAQNIMSSNIDVSKLKGQIRNIRNLNEYKDFIMKLNDEYNRETENKLFSTDEYLLLTNVRKYKDIKNIILIELM